MLLPPPLHIAPSVGGTAGIEAGTAMRLLDAGIGMTGLAASKTSRRAEADTTIVAGGGGSRGGSGSGTGTGTALPGKPTTS